jgi:hypothetical protein
MRPALATPSPQSRQQRGFRRRRQGNPSSGRPLTSHRSQIYSDMSLEDLARNLNIFHREVLR